ncbi:MAG: branched-chain amino acid ABC transporter permease [Planctomycetota bacterium]|nr:MAG: branched-chain amino acid ABC transporter permease [Planctomycetota bacterium]
MTLAEIFSWPHVIDALTLGALYALIAVGYTMVYGIIQLINFAHGEVFMVGTYVALLAVLHTGMPLVAAIALAMLACMALGLLIDFTAYLPLRRRSPGVDAVSIAGLTAFALLAVAYFELGRREVTGLPVLLVTAALALIPLGLLVLALLSMAGRLGRPKGQVASDRLSALITAIGMSLSLQTIAQLLWTADYRAFPASALPAFFGRTIWTVGEPPHQAAILGKEIVIWVAAAVLMVGLGALVSFTRTGRAMRACAQDKETAALMGVNVNSVIGFTFAVGSAMAAIAGVLYAVKVGGNISPRMGYYPGVIAFAAAVLGGIGSIRGAVAGGLVIGITQSVGGGVTLWGLERLAHGLGAIGWEGGRAGLERLVAALAPRISAYDFAFAFGLMILVILVRPWGLFGKPGGKRA